MTMPDEITPAPPTDPTDPTGQVFVEADDASPTAAEDAPARRGALRIAGVISGRIILGCVSVAAVAAVVGATVLIPLPSLRSSAGSTVVTPVPTTRQLVCPGGLLRLASASGKGATTVSAIGSPRVVSAAQPGSVVDNPFATTDAGTANGSAAPMLLGTPAVVPGAKPPLLGGSQSEGIKTSEFFGLSSAECTAASGETWLAGGATSVGRTTLLLLSNPTDVPAVVSIEVFGETGQITAPGMDGISVGAGAQRVISLAGFAPNLTSPVVHVHSTGGQVVATLEQATVRGVTPGGVDFIAGTAAPALTTVLPGVVISGTEAMQSLQGEDGFDDLQTTLRVFLPAGKATSASITVLAENGTVTGKAIRADLQPATVTDLPLDQLSDGSYTVIVTTARPVVASVRVSTAVASVTPASGAATTDGTSGAVTDGSAGATDTGTGATDFAWVTPAALLTSSVLLPIASGMTPALHLENPTARPETVTLHALSGASITKTVGAHRAISITVVAGRAYVMTGLTQLYASVSGIGPAEVTSYGVSPLTRGEGPLRVFG
jgi:hypothetical protein